MYQIKKIYSVINKLPKQLQIRNKSNKIFRKKYILLTFTTVFIMLLILLYIIPLPTTQYKGINSFSNINGEFINIDNYIGFAKLHITTENKITHAETITYVHGFGGSSFSWRNNIEYFTKAGYNVLLIDLKGFGVTQKTLDTKYDHISQAEYIFKILNHYNINKTHLVGHSMGGNISVHFALKYPNKIKSLTLVAPALVTENLIINNIGKLLLIPPFTQIYRQIITRTINMENISNFLKYNYANPEFVTNETILGYFLPLDIEDWDLALLGTLRDATENILPTDYIQQLQNHTFPIQIIWGEYDKIIPLTNGFKLNTQIRKATFRIIPKAGHLPMEEKPSEFNELMTIFLNKAK
ncbi:MAG: alpha/beta hydrolase [Candidatus Dojkabacteria bacterium]|nr:alpha/beta hydrolase [Candidatus Dojkabacteria bacterium]